MSWDFKTADFRCIGFEQGAAFRIQRVPQAVFEELGVKDRTASVFLFDGDLGSADEDEEGDDDMIMTTASLSVVMMMMVMMARC